MLITSVFAWVLLAAGLYRNREAAELLDSWWLGSWYKFDPSFSTMLTETLYACLSPAAPTTTATCVRCGRN